MMGAKTLEAQIADGTAKVQGDITVLAKLASTMVDFDPRFEVMTGTQEKPAGRLSCSRLPSRAGADHRGVGGSGKSGSLRADTG